MRLLKINNENPQITDEKIDGMSIEELRKLCKKLRDSEEDSFRKYNECKKRFDSYVKIVKEKSNNIQNFLNKINEDVDTLKTTSSSNYLTTVF